MKEGTLKTHTPVPYWVLAFLISALGVYGVLMTFPMVLEIFWYEYIIVLTGKEALAFLGLVVLVVYAGSAWYLESVLKSIKADKKISFKASFYHILIILFTSCYITALNFTLLIFVSSVDKHSFKEPFIELLLCHLYLAILMTCASLIISSALSVLPFFGNLDKGES